MGEKVDPVYGDAPRGTLYLNALARQHVELFSVLLYCGIHRGKLFDFPDKACDNAAYPRFIGDGLICHRNISRYIVGVGYRAEAQRAQREAKKEAQQGWHHKCSVCGKTDADYPGSKTVGMIKETSGNYYSWVIPWTPPTALVLLVR